MKSKIFAMWTLSLLCSAVFATTTTIGQTSCYDYDGSDYYTGGNTYGQLNGVTYSYADNCSNNASVIEYFCGGAGAAYANHVTIQCAANYICSEGRCIITSATTTTYPTSIPSTTPPTTAPNTCQDTDGTDITVKGSTCGYLGGRPYNYTDACIGSAYVKEYYCSGISPSSPDMLYSICPQGYACSDGACEYSTTSTVSSTTNPTSISTTAPPTTVPATCQDTDGTDMTVKGTTSGSLGGMSYSYVDYCIGTSYLREYYCGGSGASYPEMTGLRCPTYYICSDGACVYSTTSTVSSTTYPTSIPTTTPTTTASTTSTSFACSIASGYENCTTSEGLAGVCRWGNCWALGACCYYVSAGQCEYTNGHDCTMYGLGRFLAGTTCDTDTCATASTTSSTAVTWPTSKATTTSTSSAPVTTYIMYSCFDSDGTDYSSFYAQGSVEGLINAQTYGFTDYCTDDYLNEWTCVGGSPQLQMYVPCPFTCADGACTENITITTTTTTPPVSTPAECSDTDGLDAYTKGTVTGWFGRSSDAFNNSDACVNSTTVEEYFCRYNADFRESMNIDCQSGTYCIDGRCVYGSGQDVCQESNGRNTSVKGYIWGTYLGQTFNYTDTCINSTTLTERFCIYSADDRPQPYYETAYCPTGTLCSEGICTSDAPNTCEDSDELNTLEKGITHGTLNDREYNHTDTCYSEHYVQEFYCGGLNVTLPQMTTFACSDNETCREGRCVPGNASGLRECNMPGNGYPCDQMAMDEVVDSIVEWVDARIDLGDIIRLILSWSDPEANAPN